MKYSMIAVLVLGLLYGFGIGATEEPAAAKTDEEKVNYSLGYELGKDLKGQWS